ncbi:Unknown protein [Striga hermonthica]|uniref:F-box/LRR-repeat protein 15/At3g58940/PEG3-like LRR domain-containing protein n=1 Tax=Striga hermonthica TaxID=68872 RepID=A0A9N7RK27_STRHE|nr:Unknown protein [Striga hermonthica]
MTGMGSFFGRFEWEVSGTEYGYSVAYSRGFEGSTRPDLDFSEERFDDTQEKSVSANCSSILHYILYLLCRPWRHRGSTLPNLNSSGSTGQNFFDVVNRTLQGYLDQNLSIHKLHLDFSRPDSPTAVVLLGKWIPMIAALNIKVFKLNSRSYTPAYYNLPSVVFLAESLEELHLCRCRVSPVESVRFKILRTLTLQHVQVDGATFETIMLGCPLLRRLVLTYCLGLRNVRLSKAASPGLKHFELDNFEWTEGHSIEIDVPNLEKGRIVGPWIWCHHQSKLLFPRLTNLDLNSVILSRESFDLLSFGCPTLESLTLFSCSGFEEFHLASDSVKWLTISTSNILLKGATICAPNILRFTFFACILQPLHTFSFTTTTSKDWSSQIYLSSYKDDPDFNVNWWFLELRRMLKALSGSRISLFLRMDGGPQNVPCSTFLGDEPPVMVRDLDFATCKCRTASWYSDFTNGLFRVCRPSHVRGGSFVRVSDKNCRLSEFQLNILLANKNVRTEPYFWSHDLEQVHVDGQLVQWRDLSKLRNRTYDRDIWLELKWRGHNYCKLSKH